MPDGPITIQSATPAHRNLRLVVTKGLFHPWGMAFLPGGQILITERPGRVRMVREGVLEVVVCEPTKQEHDLTTCAERVADSPAAARRMIRSLDKLVQASSDPRWSSIREELLKLAARIQAEDHRQTRWQRS